MMLIQRELCNNVPSDKPPPLGLLHREPKLQAVVPRFLHASGFSIFSTWLWSTLLSVNWMWLHLFFLTLLPLPFLFLFLVWSEHSFFLFSALHVSLDLLRTLLGIRMSAALAANPHYPSQAVHCHPIILNQSTSHSLKWSHQFDYWRKEICSTANILRPPLAY